MMSMNCRLRQPNNWAILHRMCVALNMCIAYCHLWRNWPTTRKMLFAKRLSSHCRKFLRSTQICSSKKILFRWFYVFHQAFFTLESKILLFHLMQVIGLLHAYLLVDSLVFLILVQIENRRLNFEGILHFSPHQHQ